MAVRPQLTRTPGTEGERAVAFLEGGANAKFFRHLKAHLKQPFSLAF